MKSCVSVSNGIGLANWEGEGCNGREGKGREGKESCKCIEWRNIKKIIYQDKKSGVLSLRFVFVSDTGFMAEDLQQGKVVVLSAF